MSDLHYQRMMHALRLAQDSMTRVHPNPKVGCVIYTQNHTCIATGVTDVLGSDHAEIKALAQLKSWQQQSKSTVKSHHRRPRSHRKKEVSQEYHMYVTLEPCAHYGRTPPCVLSIIKAGITHVYVGTLDPNPQVQGQGIAILEQAGIQVYLGIAEQECDHWHAAFKKWITQKIPWVTIKGAMTLDGCLATAQGHSQWITGIEARTHVHQVRAQVDAIMIGGATARIDQPQLNVRHCEGSDPIAVVLSRTLALPKKLPCIREGSICVHGPLATPELKDAWIKRGASLIEVPLEEDKNQLNLSAVLQALGAKGITHILVEGGGKLHASLIEANSVDDVMLYIAPKIIGKGRPLFALPSVATIPDGWYIENKEVSLLGEDLLIHGDLRRIQDVLEDEDEDDSCTFGED